MSKLSKRTRGLNIFLSVVFIVFALVQLNDPDPFVWFTIYTLVAVALVVSAFRPLSMKGLYLFSILLLVYAFYHLPYLVQWLASENPGELFGEMSDDKYYLEGTREFLGLLIALAAILYLNMQNKNRD